MFNSIPVYKTPICPRCGMSRFGIKELEVQNANWVHYAIICMACGCIVGTESVQDTSILNKIADRLGV